MKNQGVKEERRRSTDVCGPLKSLQFQSYRINKIMKTVNQQILQDYIGPKSICSDFEAFLKTWPLVSHLKLTNMTETKIHQLCRKINSKHNELPSGSQIEAEGYRIVWRKGQLKLYLWVLVFYCYHQGTNIESMNDEDFLYLQKIFHRQPILRIKFEAYSLVPSKMCSKMLWNQEQTTLLTKIVKGLPEGQNRIQWKEIAYDLYTLSQGRYFRTNAQCRQRWTNHIDPQIKHEKWTRDEDYILMNMMQKDGTKWADIVKALNGSRTEHMVKNRYNSLINKWKKNRNKWNNHQIEKRIIQLIMRSADRGKKQLPGMPVSKDGKKKYNKKNYYEIFSDSEELDDIQSEEKNNQNQQKQEKVSVDISILKNQIAYKDDVSFQQTERHSDMDLSPYPAENSTIKLLPFLDFDSHFSDINLSYYRNEKIKKTMEDVARQFGCHVEQVDHLLNDCQEDRLFDSFQQY